MKPMVAVVAVLSVCLGMLAVLLFRGPPAPKLKPATTLVERADEAPPARSRRIALPSTTIPVAPHVPSASTKPGVAPELAQKNREGIVALDRGELVRAAQLFQECAEAAPEEPIFRQNLAEALARTASDAWDRGGVTGQQTAIEHMARALELAPDREDVKRRLEQMRALVKSEDGLFTESSAHFELSYDGERNDLAWKTTDVFEALERAYLDFNELFDVDPIAAGRGKIHVVVYKREGFHGATGMGHWAGGLYDGSIRVPLEDLGRERSSLRRVLRHELAHAFVHELGGRDVAGWLNEGLAQLLEVEGPEREQTVTVAREKLVAAQRAGIPLAPLSGLKDNLSSLGDDATISRGYAQALAFVAFLSREHGERVPYQLVAGHKQPDGIAGEFQRRAGIALDTAFGDFQARLR